MYHSLSASQSKRAFVISYGGKLYKLFRKRIALILRCWWKGIKFGQVSINGRLMNCISLKAWMFMCK